MSEAMQEVVRRADKDPKFLAELLTNPTEATKAYPLTDQERAALSGTTAERLIALRPEAEVARGCGSAGITCTVTCQVTCTHTFGRVLEA